MGFPKIRGYLFGGPHNKEYTILGSILGSFILGNYQIFRWRNITYNPKGAHDFENSSHDFRHGLPAKGLGF